MSLVCDDRSATMTGTTWVNKSGLANLAQGVAGNRPVAGTAINGRPTLAFDGTDDRMDGGQLSAYLSAGAGAIWVVGRTGTIAASVSAPGDECWFNDATGNFIFAPCTTNGVGAGFWDTAYRYATPMAYVSSTVYAVRVYWNGTTLFAKASGLTERSVAFTTIGTMTGTFRLVGAGLQCEIAAAYAMPTAPSASHLAFMDAWTLARWGVAAG